jgi:hypothetical protein
VNFLLPANAPRSAVIERINKALGVLDAGKSWTVEIDAHKPKRTTDQNSLLWSIYSDILDKGGEAMGGWTKEDLHSFFLLDYFGGETIEVFGKKRQVPLKRSSKLSKAEFSAYVEHIVRFMAQRGVVIEMPGDF